MAGTGRDARAERLNERLRGAQRTNIGDESFSIDIPGLEQPATESAPPPPPVTVQPPNSAKRRGARDARAERLNERLRGAQRANVGDESFNLEIAGAGPSIESPPNSAKRRRLDRPASRDRTESVVSNSGGSARRRSTRKSPRSDPYELPSTSKESGAGQIETEGPTSIVPPSEDRLVPEPDEADLSVVRVIAELERDPLDGIDMSDDGTEPDLSIQSVARTITNKPTDRRASRVSGEGRFNSSALASSAKLRDAYDTQQAMSSPSERKSTRRSSASMSNRSARTSGGTIRRSPLARGEQNDDADELSPDRPRLSAAAGPNGNKNKQAARAIPAKVVSSRIPSGSPDDEVDELSPNRSHEETPDDEPTPVPVAKRPQPTRPPPPEDRDEADEVDDRAAAAVIGKRKRGRPSKSLEARPQSPQEEPEDEPDAVPKKRKRGRPSTSPAMQKQPAVKPKAKAGRKPRASSPTAADKRPSKPAPKTKKTSSPKQRRRSSEGDENAAFEVTVQRFVHHKRRAKKAGASAGAGDGSDSEGADDDIDPLQLEIPFANRTAESAVDVFAQLCEEVIGNMLAQFEEHLRNATDTARKKEIRVKIRAVEAYREELNVRLLQHAIHVNNWYTLRKRVRQAQKEKMALRDEILRLRAEREQVALRMDAVRIKHEKESKESSFLLDTSSVMRDIDQAVAEGRDAPELPPKAQKEAELANLELIVAQVAEQVGGAGGGGMLGQIRDFNAFLERAAVALESR